MGKKKRTGSAEKRSGTWFARPTLADGTRGNRVPLPKCKSDDEARAEAQRLTDVAQKKNITAASVAATAPVEPQRGRTLVSWGEDWLDDRERRGLSSVRTDRGRWTKWVVPQLGKLDMAGPASEVTDRLERFVAFLDDQVRASALAWKTARNVWGLVSKAFDDASHSKTLALRVRRDNPAQGVRPPDEGPERAKQFLYPTEFLQLMGCEAVPKRWRELVAAQTYLYCRAGELEALHVEDVDLQHRMVHIHRSVDRDHDGELKATKTQTGRRIPIEPNLMPLLTELVARARTEGRERLIKMPPISDLAARLRTYLQRAGVARAELYRTTATAKQMTWHDLRATAATWLAIRGEDPQRIMALCGHENMETTMGYVRLAAVLHVDPASVFPPLALPQGLPQGPKGWGSQGGKLSRSLAAERRPQRDSNPLEQNTPQPIQHDPALSERDHSAEQPPVSARNVVFGAALGQQPSPALQNPIGGVAEQADERRCWAHASGPRRIWYVCEPGLVYDHDERPRAYSFAPDASVTCPSCRNAIAGLRVGAAPEAAAGLAALGAAARLESDVWDAAELAAHRGEDADVHKNENAAAASEAT